MKWLIEFIALFLDFLIQLSKILQTKVPAFDIKQRHASSGEDTESLTKKLFSKLTNEAIEKLYKLYHVDFEMFQYEYKYFLH